MKDFLARIFLLSCAVVFIFNSALFFMLRLGRLSPEAVIIFYQSHLQTQRGPDIVLGLAIGSLIGGLIFLDFAFRSGKEVKSIVIKGKERDFKISIDAVKNFVTQILGKHSSMSDFGTTMHKNGKWIYIDVQSSFGDTDSVLQQVHQVGKSLREQMELAFGFPYFKVNFQIRGINIESNAR